MIGAWADVASGALTNATAIGAGAIVSANDNIQLGNTDVLNVRTSGTITAGAVTYPNTDGAAGTVLTANANGIPTWAAASSGGVHTIGESYGGGIVFYVYDGGKHGLIAATADQTTSTGIRWYGGTYTNTRARADGVGAGIKNTALIIANQGAVDRNPFAATICNEYSVTETVGGISTTYGDWYLPSKYELNLLYLQKTVVGGLLNEPYWSSTEPNDISNPYGQDTRAWSQFFLDGSRNLDEKMFDAGRVRAIRAF
jgi:hypothetical protein